MNFKGGLFPTIVLMVIAKLLKAFQGVIPPHCDGDIKEIDSSQLNINLNLSTSKHLKKFEILQHHNIFAIHSSTGILQTVRTIDRESLCQSADQKCDCLKSKCLLDITIFVTDLHKPNQPPQRIYKTICIEDINDNKPTFPETTQTLELIEKSPIGMTLELHSAHDTDSSDFGVKKYDLKCPMNMFNLSYSIVRDDNYKSDHEVKLIVTSIIAFRHEPIQCTLEACDIHYCSSMAIVIKINDVNDNSPEFPSARNYFKIKENIPLDSVIQTFQATDLDTVFGKITYSIGKIMIHDMPKAFSSNMFRIDPITGDLRVNGNIDYEERSNRQFFITVIAKDNGTPALSSSTTATIDIEDVNDNTPSINLNKVIIDVEENSNLNYLDYFIVSDNDEGANGNIECEILESSDFFKLKRSNTNVPITYEIYLTKALDHEKQSTLSIIIQCQDGGKPNLTSMKRIAVNVIDLNDNSVYFTQKTIAISIPENTPIGTEILKISTVDLDKKSDILYSFVDPNNCSFVNIDSHIGYLTTNEMFDREVKDEYVFDVQVVEKNNLNYTDVAKVILRITDINDNPPQFNMFYSFSVYENTSVDGFIGQVQAADADLGENGTIWYSHSNQVASHPIHFRISNNGEIRLFYKLDFEKQNIHQLIVIARDQGRSVSMSSSTTVLIKVLDSNNNGPKFDENFYTVSLTCQTQTIDSNLFPVTDKDKSPENVLMNYKIENIKPIQYKKIFSIDIKTGLITMTIKKEQCDFKMRDKEKVEIVIVVFDPTKPPFNDKTSLHLYLENEKYQKIINDNSIQRPNHHGSVDYSIKKNNKVPYSEPENSLRPDEFVDQNITIIMVLIFVSIFLGIFLISIVCFVKRKRQPEEGQGMKDIHL